MKGSWNYLSITSLKENIMAKRKTKSEKVWKYLLKNKTATTAEVAKATGVSYNYCWTLMNKVGTPKEVFEQDTKQPAQRLRSSILLEAEALVSKDREAEHGDANSNWETAAAYWNTHLGLTDFIQPKDVPVMMALLKFARMSQNSTNVENYRDAAGYLALAGESAKEG